MARKTFFQVLQEGTFDCIDEFFRLNKWFYNRNSPFTLCEECKGNFLRFPYRGTCISLKDFDNTYGFNYANGGITKDIDVDYLISFCEYSYNLVSTLTNNPTECSEYINQVRKVIEKAEHIENRMENGCVVFVPKKREAIIAAESVNNNNLSFEILEYNHHSMKGNLERKKNALISFATYFENKRKDLKEFNQNFERNLFTMFNEFNIRHNNNGKNPLLENITDDKLEEYYDLTYELCLTAFSILGGKESNEKVKEIRKQLGK